MYMYLGIHIHMVRHGVGLGLTTLPSHVFAKAGGFTPAPSCCAGKGKKGKGKGKGKGKQEEEQRVPWLWEANVGA